MYIKLICLSRRFSVVQRSGRCSNMVKANFSHGPALPRRILALPGGNGIRIHKYYHTN